MRKLDAGWRRVTKDVRCDRSVRSSARNEQSAQLGHDERRLQFVFVASKVIENIGKKFLDDTFSGEL